MSRCPILSCTITPAGAILVPKCCLIEVFARAPMNRLGPLDFDKQDVVIAVVGALERQAWMVRVEGVL
jgi:hypothetical protein